MNQRLFPNTSWSLIAQSQQVADADALSALDALARAYWRPLYAYVRALGVEHSQAEDEVQRLFESLMSRDSLRAVVPGQVRFRSFLLSCLKKTMVSSLRREMAQKRGEGVVACPLNELAMGVPESGLAPDVVMDRAWAREVFERAFSRLEADAERRGRLDAFHILRPALRGEAVPYALMAERLNVSEGTARKMVFDLRARFGVMIREEVSATVADPADVDLELRHLMSLL